MSEGLCYCDQCEGISVPPRPEPCWGLVMSEGSYCCDHCEGLSLSPAPQPCRAIVRDTERMTTYCALTEGHAGQCSETPINGAA